MVYSFIPQEHGVFLQRTRFIYAEEQGLLRPETHLLCQGQGLFIPKTMFIRTKDQVIYTKDMAY